MCLSKLQLMNLHLMSLASSENEFQSCLVLPAVVPIHSGKVVSAWIDLEFLEELNNR